MKNFKSILLLFSLVFINKINSQVSFTINPFLCSGNTVSVSANTGTLTAIAYSWTALPASPVFSAPSSANTTINFPSTGTFTISLGISTGSVYSYTTNTVVVNNNIPAILIVTAANPVCPGFTTTLTAFGANTYTWTGGSSTAPVFQASVSGGPGNYTVVGSNGGCSASASTMIALGSPLNISVSMSSATTCVTSNFPMFSKAVHVTAVGAGNYLWFPYSNQYQGTSQIDVRPPTSTSYTVTGSTAVCSGSLVFYVSVIPQFTIMVVPESPVICGGESVLVSVTNTGGSAAGPSSAFTYNWTEALNAPPISISSYFSPTVSVFPQNSTTYTVEVRDTSNCVSFPRLVNVSVVGICTGLDKIASKEITFSIYPNPVKDKLFIKATTNNEIDIEIINAMGKIVLKEARNFNTGNSTQSFMINMLPAGVYFIRISGEGNREITKLIKL